MSAGPAALATFALSAAGTANSLSTARSEQKLRQASTRLQLAQSRRDEQEQLSRNLARQNVVSSARGVSTSSGSMMRQALVASRNARRGVGLAASRAALSDADSNLSTSSRRNSALISFGGSSVGFGQRILPVIERTFGNE